MQRNDTSLKRKRYMIDRSFSAPCFFSPAWKKHQAIDSREIKSIVDENKTHPATLVSRTNTDQAIAIHGSEPTIFQGQTYEMLTHTRPITPRDKLSCRGSARENILVDFQSAELKKYADAFQPEPDTQPIDEELEENKIPANPNPFQLRVLEELVARVKSEFRSTTEPYIAQLIQQEHDINVAPLEWFWNDGHGFCRHQALATAYLLATLIDNHAKQQGKTFEETGTKIYRFRTRLHKLNDPTKTASHAVIIYQAENNHCYLLDATNKLVADLTELSPAEKERISKAYPSYDSEAFIQQIMDIYLKVPRPMPTIR